VRPRFALSLKVSEAALGEKGGAELHPLRLTFETGARFYLTNIMARGLRPEEVCDWTDDLWLYPYYTDPKFTPYDAR